MNKINMEVDLDTINDSLQMGEFGLLTSTLAFLRDELLNGSDVLLKRFPVNCEPILFKRITTVAEFDLWAGPYIKVLMKSPF